MKPPHHLKFLHVLIIRFQNTKLVLHTVPMERPPQQDSHRCCHERAAYLIDCFLFMNRYFEVGAPVYFVTTGGYNFSSEEGMNAICSSAGCNNFSLTQKIQYA